MNKSKLCFIDTETTGVDPKTASLFQISAVLVDPETRETLDTLSLVFRPDADACLEQGALDKTGYTAEQLAQLPLGSKEAFDTFTRWCSKHVNRYAKKDKMHFVAYNATFDVGFVRQWFLKHGDAYFGSYFWAPGLCVMAAAAWFIQSHRHALPNFQLATLCQCAELGWDPAAAHQASYDVSKTVELYWYLRENLSLL
jgi:DNA polymerase III alpha subunit (gram-positive type)